MATVALDADAVRARFSALRRPTAFLDAPGGTQVPDSVIDAISGYLRDSNANLGGAFGSSRRTDALLAQSRLAAAAFLRCEPDETIFGANMTTLNFALTRAAARTFRAGDEILVTKLDHDGNVSPWLELAHDLDLKVGLVELHDDTTLDYDDLERKLTDRTRVVAFPLASNAVGTTTLPASPKPGSGVPVRPVADESELLGGRTRRRVDDLGDAAGDDLPVRLQRDGVGLVASVGEVGGRGSSAPEGRIEAAVGQVACEREVPTAAVERRGGSLRPPRRSSRRS